MPLKKKQYIKRIQNTKQNPKLILATFKITSLFTHKVCGKVWKLEVLSLMVQNNKQSDNNGTKGLFHSHWSFCLIGTRYTQRFQPAVTTLLTVNKSQHLFCICILIVANFGERNERATKIIVATFLPLNWIHLGKRQVCLMPTRLCSVAPLSWFTSPLQCYQVFAIILSQAHSPQTNQRQCGIQGECRHTAF